MADHHGIAQKMQEHFQAVWQLGDAWELETSEYEQNRYQFLLHKLAGRRYGNALEIGCGSGCFTRMLAGICDRVVALDIAPAAIERARLQTAGVTQGVIDLRVGNIIEFDLDAGGPWDLIVLSE